MKNKDLIAAMTTIAIFIILIFLTPVMDDRSSAIIWVLFYIIGSSLVVIWILSLNTSKNMRIEEFKRQPKIMQMMEAICVISLIYDITHIDNEFYISAVAIGIMVIAYFCIWFFKKEE